MDLPRPPRRIARTSAHASLVARDWADQLKTMQAGEEITYADLAALTGVDPQRRRDLLTTARELVLRQHGLVFDVVVDTGLVCLGEADKLGLSQKRFEAVTRTNRKTGAILGTVQAEALTPVEQNRLWAHMAAVAMVSFTLAPQTLLQLETQQQPQRLEVNPADYQHLFKGL